MIYNGKTGYLSGALNQPSGTVLAMTKGPIKGRNWHAVTINPTYSYIMSTGATGTVALQGTNDVAFQSAKEGDRVLIEADFLPTEAATWTDIHAASNSTQSGSIAVEYQFLRLLLAATGTGYCLQAWVRWS